MNMAVLAERISVKDDREVDAACGIAERLCIPA
jgi:hypothetical protein